MASTLLALLLCLAFTAGSTSAMSRSERDAAPLRVAVTVPPQAWIVERLLGADAEIVTVVGPNQSHETYQPTDREASLVMRSSIYFTIGLGLERGPWFDAVQRSPGVTIVDCRTGVPMRELESAADLLGAPSPSGGASGHAHEHDQDQDHDHGHQHGPGCAHADGLDPHIWLSPALLKTQAATMADAIVAARPDLAPRVRTAQAALTTELDELDASLRATLAPHRGRSFLVFHPAWGYFADAYGLRQLVIENAGRPPSDRELTRIQQAARAAGIRTVFVEPQIGGRPAEAVARAIGGAVVVIDPMARDVPTNLRRVAETVAGSFQ